jgi:hypothetical protein
MSVFLKRADENFPNPDMSRSLSRERNPFGESQKTDDGPKNHIPMKEIVS